MELIIEQIKKKIYTIRGLRVMLDFELADLYKIETKQLKRQVKRNIIRFPSDFMFELNKEEMANLRYQIGTSSWGGTRYDTMAFTEEGVAMLSSVLNNNTAIATNIEIIRVFTRMKELLIAHKDIIIKIEELDNRVVGNEEDIKVIFEALKQLIQSPPEPRVRIGFKHYD